MRKELIILSLSSFFMACNSAVPTEKPVTAVSYFDLKGYMAKEAGRLNAAMPLISKTVLVDTAAESTSIKIADWNKEFSVFSDADINKSAWKGLFVVTRTEYEDSYKSDNDKVPVKSLVIHHKNGKVKSIKILISNTNSLYSSNDTLSYYPDSLYEIRKMQHIKLLNEKIYRITGKF